MAPNTLESEVPPLKAIGSRLGMVKMVCSTQQTQTSLFQYDGRARKLRGQCPIDLGLLLSF